MSRFFVALLMSSGCLAAGLLLPAVFGATFTLPSFCWPSLILLTLATALIFRYLYRTGPALFIQLYLLTMVIKLLAYAAYILAMILLHREGAVANVVFFLVTYFIFTFLEVVFLYPKINR